MLTNDVQVFQDIDISIFDTTLPLQREASRFGLKDEDEI